MSGGGGGGASRPTEGSNDSKAVPTAIRISCAFEASDGLPPPARGEAAEWGNGGGGGEMGGGGGETEAEEGAAPFPLAGVVDPSSLTSPPEGLAASDISKSRIVASSSPDPDGFSPIMRA